MLPEDSFYFLLDNPEVSSSRHKYFVWSWEKKGPFSMVLGL